MKDKVLEILRKEARIGAADIARRLGSETEQVETIIADLEKTKTILGYQAIVNDEKLEREHCVGIIEVRINPQRDRGYDNIAPQIYRYPEVTLCYLLSGSYDLLVHVEGESLKDVALFVTEKLATIENVESTTTHFILKKYKRFGVAMGGDERAERLVVAP